MRKQRRQTARGCRGGGARPAGEELQAGPYRAPYQRIARERELPCGRQGLYKTFAMRLEVIEKNQEVARIPHRHDLEIRCGNERAGNEVTESLRGGCYADAPRHDEEPAD